MKFQDLDLNKYYTYADYLSWKMEETVELIRGRVFRMSPAPSAGHQHISTKLLSRIDYFLGSRPCRVFHAPFDVRLPLPPDRIEPEQIHTVVQPDLSVICDPEKVDRRGCLGAPDWIVEIISPGTAKKDVRDKFEVYEFSGVKEYWIVYPADLQVLVFTLSDTGKYVGHQPYTHEDKISPVIFPELIISLKDVFPDLDLVEEAWTEYARL